MLHLKPSMEYIYKTVLQCSHSLCLLLILLVLNLIKEPKILLLLPLIGRLHHSTRMDWQKWNQKAKTPCYCQYLLIIMMTTAATTSKTRANGWRAAMSGRSLITRAGPTLSWVTCEYSIHPISIPILELFMSSSGKCQAYYNYCILICAYWFQCSKALYPYVLALISSRR